MENAMSSYDSRFVRGVSVGRMPVLNTYSGTVRWVRSSSGANGDGSFKRPFSTIDAAINACSANDLIMVKAGHAESITAAAGIDADVSGISIVGMGSGEQRPVVTFTTATTADVDIDAANVTIANILFKVDVDALAAPIDVNSTDFTLENCEFREGSAKQWATCVDINGGSANACDRTTIRGCKFVSYTAGADNAIKLAEVADEVTIERCIIDGDFTDAGIHNPTGKVMTNLRLINNVVRNRQTGDHAIELVSACTGEAVGNRLFGDTPGAVFDPGSLLCSDNWEAHKIDAAAVPSPAGQSGPEGWIHVAKAAATLPATTTQNIFTVSGGRVRVKVLIGEVTTAVQAQLCNLKVTHAATAGGNVDLASNLDINGFALGRLFLVEGDGTALVSNGGALLNGVGTGEMVLAAGTTRIETSATNTGATKWDIWYQPLDAGAAVVSA